MEKIIRPTITDVARLAGVSTGTVSNALSGKRHVAETTQQRIQQAIEDLSYHPNLLARGLINKRSYVIAVVISELKDLGFFGYSSALTGIQQEARQLGYSLMLHFVDDPSEQEITSTLNRIGSHEIDGIIWAIHEIEGNRDWTHTILPQNYPPIIFLNMHPDPSLNVISIDNRAGAMLAVSHLIDQGCNKIGIITGPATWWESQARLAGWREVLASSGLPVDPSYIVEGNWLAVSGQVGMETLLERHPDLDAVFASNDSMALGAIYSARCHNLSIPDDIMLVGYDDTPEAQSYWPPLTSVHQSLQQCGQMAVEELHTLIEARGAEQEYKIQQHIIQPELVIRQSTSPLLWQQTHLCK